MGGGPTTAAFTETPLVSARSALHGSAGLAPGRRCAAFGLGLRRAKQCFLEIRDLLGKHRPFAGEGGVFGALRFRARLEIGPRSLWLDRRVHNHRQGRLFSPREGLRLWLLLLLCRERRRDV